MKLLLSTSILAIGLVSCGSLKKTEKAISDKNYDEAISIALEEIELEGEDQQDYVVLLETAYEKAAMRDNSRISYFNLRDNEDSKEKINEAYVRMDDRQEKIKPVLPLRVDAEDRDAVFVMEDYGDYIETSKEAVVEKAVEEADAQVEEAVENAETEIEQATEEATEEAAVEVESAIEKGEAEIEEAADKVNSVEY